jgi:hypothetical protein
VRLLLSSIKFLSVLLVIVSMAIAGSASATSITLSEMSNNEGELGGVDNLDLDAIFTFEIGNFDLDADDELQLTVNNTSTFDINEILFNKTANVGIVSLLTFPNVDAGWNDTGTGMVGGFGSFDVHLVANDPPGTNQDIVNNGGTDVFVLDFTCLGVCTVDDFLTENVIGKAAAAKFVNGFEALGGDSAYGGSSLLAIPEPGTALLMGLGLVGLASIKRRA